MIARGKPPGSQECGPPEDALPEVGVGVPLLPAAAGDPHRDPPGVVLRTGLEQLVDRPVGVDALLRAALAALQVLERREHPPLEARQVYVEPVVVPVDFLGIEEELPFVSVEPGEKIVRVVGAENELLAGDERPERVVLALALDDEVLERVHVPLERFDHPDQGTDGFVRGPVEHAGQGGGGLPHPLEGVFFEAVGADRLRLHPGERLVPELHPGGLVAEVPALVDPDDVHQPLHPGRIPVPAGHLVHEVGLRHDRLGGHRQRRRGDQVHRHHIQNDSGTDRKQVLAAERHPDERGAGGEALVPAGVGERERALHDRRSHDRARDPVRARHQLIPEALRVGVDVRPAPTLRLFDAEVAEPAPDPFLPLAGDGERHRTRIVRIAAFLGEPLAGRFLKGVRARLVLRFVAHPDGEAFAVLDLLLHRELLVLPIAAREVADQGFILPHLARSHARDEAGADVHEGGALHPPGEGDGVPGPVDVRLERRLERRVERHPPGTVEHQVDVGRDLGGAGFRIAEVVARDVPAEDDDLLVQEIVQRGPVALAQGRERRGVLHDVLEPDPALRLAGGPHHEIDAPDLREELEEHPETDLPQESGPAEQQDAPAGEGFPHVDPGAGHLGHGGLMTPRGS